MDINDCIVTNVWGFFYNFVVQTKERCKYEMKQFLVSLVVCFRAFQGSRGCERERI